MNDILKTPGLENPETYVLTHNRFNTYIVLIFTDLKKAQIYKMPYRDSPHHEIEIIMSFDCLPLFRPNEHDKNFLFEIGNKKYFCVGEKLFTFETDDKIEKNSSEHGNNDVKYSFAYGKENIYFMLHQKYIPLQEYESLTVKNEYDYLYKKNEEITNDHEGVDIVYGEDFLNCEVIHSKQ